MSFPRYPTYANSEVEWLGEIPAHWAVRPLRELSSGAENSFTDGDWIEAPYITDHGIRLLQTGNIGVGEFREQGYRYISVDTLEELGCTAVRPGDVLICRLADPVGRACAAPNLGVPMITSVDVCILKPRSDVDPRFLVYRLSAADYLGYMEAQCRGGTRDRVSRSFLSTTRISIPPLPEQREIASFLDSETSRIDTLLVEQQRLVELLKQKRQAAISHAVTKGLNPHAPMKPSGVEWLGQIPAHWETQRFQRCVKIAEGQVDPEGSAYSKLVLVAPNHVEARTGRLLGTETAAEQSAESGKYFCRKGDVIYSKIRPQLRKVVVAPADCLCSADMYPLRAYAGLTNDFLYWFLLSEPFSAFAVLESQRVAMPKVNRESLKEVTLPVPPTAEQQAISGALNQSTAAIDALVAQAERAISLLEEHRNALISAAVTGKIDVRSLADTEPGAEAA